MILLLLACKPPSCGGELDTSLAQGAFLYQDQVLPTFTITMDEEAIAGLATDGRSDAEDVHATFEFQGESWDVGLHLKGHSSFRPYPEKSAYKIDFHEWDREASFFGVRRLTLNNMTLDPSGLSEAVGYRVYQAFGLPAPRQGFACVVVNGQDNGVYSIIETMDEQFIDRAFEDDDGWLYEGSFGADFLPPLVDAFLVQEEGEGEAHADLAVLAEELRQAEDVMDVLELRFDAEATLTAWAIEITLGNHDGYIVRGNNFLTYHEPGPDRWWMLPWGSDELLNVDLDPYAPKVEGNDRNTRGLLYSRCLESPDCLAALEERYLVVADWMEEVELSDYAGDLADGIGRAVAQDEMSPASESDSREDQREKVSFLEDRPDQIRTYIERGP